MHTPETPEAHGDTVARLFHNAPVGLFRTRLADGSFETVNARCASMLGFDSVAECLARCRTPNLYVNQDLRRQVLESLRTTGEAHDVEAEIRRHDGDVIWVMFSATLDREAHCADGVLVDITDRKRMEGALERGLAQYRLLFEVAPHGLTVADAAGSILESNREAERILGLRREEHHQRHIGGKEWRIIRPDGTPMPPEEFASVRALAEGRVVREVEMGIVKPEGTTWISVNAAPTREPEGGVIISYVDITARKRAEEELRQHERRLHAILQGMEESVSMLDEQGVFLFANARAAANLAGDPRRDLRGSSLSDFLPAGQVEPLLRAYGEALASGDAHTKELCLNMTGGERCFRNTLRPLRDEHGGPPAVLSISLDITDRCQAERSLERSERMLRDILTRAPLLCVSLDRQGKVVFANDHLLTLTGWTREEVLHQDWFDRFLPKAIREAVRDVFRRTMRQADVGGNATYENEILTQSGETRAVGWYNVLTRDEIGAAQGVTCLGVDLTARRQLLAELTRARDEAERVAAAKSEFLATMSLEIRTPLNGVLGMLQLLETTSLDAEQRQFLDLASASAHSLLRLLADVLDLARIEAGRLDIAAEPFALEDVLRPVMSAFRHEAERKGLRLELAIHPGLTDHLTDRLPGRLVGDAGRIRQILYNLVANAVKYTERGEVRLEIAALPSPRGPEATTLYFVARDTGVGIPDAMLDQIFEAFTQADGSHTRRHGGSGLGLAIVKRLIRLMGGSLCLETGPGLGVRAHGAIPLRIEPGAEAPRPAARRGDVIPAACDGVSLQGLRVLVVEDEAVNSRLTLEFLRRLGCRGEAVADGIEALALLRRESFDLVLMDVQMPAMEGTEATRRIRSGEAGEAQRALPVIALTAHAMAGDRERFLAAGMNDYLAKPLELPALEAVLRRWRRPAE